MKKALILPLFLVLLISCTSYSSSTERVEININENSTVTINGAVIKESALENHLDGMTLGEHTEVFLTVDEEAKMGLVTDVQKSLKHKAVEKITYSTNRS